MDDDMDARLPHAALLIGFLHRPPPSPFSLCLVITQPAPSMSVSLLPHRSVCARGSFVVVSMPVAPLGVQRLTATAVVVAVPARRTGAELPQTPISSVSGVLFSLFRS